MKELLKLTTCGSVDDGKSTLIGHLMYNIKAVYTDQIAELELNMKAKGIDEIDYSLFLDGLEAEREQGITIDVAYRYFSTSKRSFIIADCPGHNEYTRNMAVGASFADVAVILVDSSKGVLPQTIRHFRICALMGIKNYIFAINKMDLVGYQENVFNSIKNEITKELSNSEISSILFLPVSAKEGDNITTLSENTGWYNGPTLLDYLENIETGVVTENGFVMPVQRIGKMINGKRGYQGSIESGCINIGDTITVYPSKESAIVESIVSAGKEQTSATIQEQVMISLNNEIDISRGCVLVNGFKPSVATNINTTMLWLDDVPPVVGKSYYIKIGTNETPATISSVESISELAKNDIFTCTLTTSSVVVADKFSNHKSIGGFILVDRRTFATAACGRVEKVLDSDYIFPVEFDISREVRSNQKNQKPFTIWLTGLAASGKTTTANVLEKKLFAMGLHTMTLDGDNLRTGINSNLGFSNEDRSENIRRTAQIAKILNDAGLISIVSLISPFEKDRNAACEIIGNTCVLAYVSANPEVCEKRDKKGYYAKAKAGKIKNFTGVTGGYEVPCNPDIVVDTANLSPNECADVIIDYLKDKKYI